MSVRAGNPIAHLSGWRASHEHAKSPGCRDSFFQLQLYKRLKRKPDFLDFYVLPGYDRANQTRIFSFFFIRVSQQAKHYVLVAAVVTLPCRSG